MNTIRKPPLSVVIITLNAERTLAQTLQSVNTWADEIVLVDSGSTDATLSVARSYGCRILHHRFDGFGTQKQFAVNQATHNWVLLLDADEVLDATLQHTIQQTLNQNPDTTQSFSLPRSLVFMGKPLQHGGEFNRPVVRLFNRQHARVSDALVHETVITTGPVSMLSGVLWHDSYGSLHEYIAKMNQYTSLNARQSGKRPRRRGPLDVSVRFAFKFVKVYFFKGSILDGLPGFVWAFFSAVYPVLKYSKQQEWTTIKNKRHRQTNTKASPAISQPLLATWLPIGFSLMAIS